MRLSLTAFQGSGKGGRFSPRALCTRVVKEIQLRRRERVPYPDTETLVCVSICNPTAIQRKRDPRRQLVHVTKEIRETLLAENKRQLVWEYGYSDTLTAGVSVRCEWQVPGWYPETFAQAILADCHEDWTPAKVPEPTVAFPGTAEKIQILRARIEAGEELWHEEDATAFGERSTQRSYADSIFEVPRERSLDE